jgi:hypothetical protein
LLSWANHWYKEEKAKGQESWKPCGTPLKPLPIWNMKPYREQLYYQSVLLAISHSDMILSTN